MTDEELWSRYAAAALSDQTAYGVKAADMARVIADAMLAAHKERWPQKEHNRIDPVAFYRGFPACANWLETCLTELADRIRQEQP